MPVSLEEFISMIPEDYLDRVCTGVLGEMNGVYLRRPFEGRTYNLKETNMKGSY